MSCPTCHKLAIPETDVLTAINLPEDTRGTFLHRQCPAHSFCYCGNPLGHGSLLPPAATIVLQSAAPQVPSSSGATPSTPSQNTDVSCPSLPTIKDAVTVPALNAQFTIATDCPGSFVVGGNIILPGRGVFRIDDVDLTLKSLTVRNINVQPNLQVLAGTRVWSLPGLGDVFDSFLQSTYGGERTSTLEGTGLLFLTPDGLKIVAPEEGTFLAGGPGDDGEFPYWKLRPLSELLETIAPGFSAGGVRIARNVPLSSFTVAGSETITAPDLPAGVDIESIWLGMTLQNDAADAERNFTVGGRTYTVRRESYLRIHESFPYTGATIPVTIPTDCQVVDVICTGYDGKLAA